MQYSQLNDDSENAKEKLQQNQNNQKDAFSIATNARSSLRSIGLGSSASVSPAASSSLKEPLKLTQQQSSDPFYVFREDLYRKLDLVEDALQKFTSLSSSDNNNSNNRSQRQKQKKLVKRAIRTAESTLRDVKTTVSLVESQRDRFPHIDASELYERQALVTTSQDRLEKAKQSLEESPNNNNFFFTNKKKNNKENTTVAKKTNDNNNGYSNGDDVTINSDIESNNNNNNNNNALTQTLMKQQDSMLDELGVAVERVGTMAQTMDEEIGYQNKLLENLEDDLDDAEEKLGLVMGKLGKLLKTKDKWQLRSILVLVLIMLVLIFLILF